MYIWSDQFKREPHELNKPELDFTFEHTYITEHKIKEILESLDSVSNIRTFFAIPLIHDIHIKFDYHQIPYVVYEPWADSSLWCIEPEKEFDGKVDISELKNAFKNYRPNLVRRIIGYVFNFMFLKGKNGFKMLK